MAGNETTPARPEDRVQDILARFDTLPITEYREWAEELVKSLSELYGGALQRVTELILEQPKGVDLLRLLSIDPKISGVLVLHDLHPLSITERAKLAIEEVSCDQSAVDIHLLEINPETGQVRIRVLDMKGGWEKMEDSIRSAFDRYVPEVWEFRFERPVPSTPIRLRRGNGKTIVTETDPVGDPLLVPGELSGSR